MVYLADTITSTDTPLVVGAFVTIIGAFLGVAKVMLNQATKDRDADRAERIKLSKAITLMALNSSKVAKATENSAAEAKQRNGHLGEQNLQIAQLVSAQSTDISDIKEHITRDQFVKEQTVVHQTVTKKSQE